MVLNGIDIGNFIICAGCTSYTVAMKGNANIKNASSYIAIKTGRHTRNLTFPSNSKHYFLF